MRYVKQRHANGCGAAALAMVAGVSYDRAAQLIQPKRQKGEKFKGALLEDALQALNEIGTTYRVRFDRKLRKIQNNAYVSVSLPCGCRHAVAWDPKNKQVLDPDPYDQDHDGNRLMFTRNYVEKHLNYIVEIIPS